MNLYFNKTFTRFENLLAAPDAAVTPKARSVFRCTNCGADHPKWAGRCDVCGEWNTLVEEMVDDDCGSDSGRGVARIGGQKSLAEGGSVAADPADFATSRAPRAATGKPDSMNSISCSAAESFRARWFSSAESRASGNPRCFFRSRAARGARALDAVRVG